MKWSNNIKLSYKALMQNKSRLIFSILSIAIGISSVITTVSIGEGAKEQALAPIRAMGNNLLVINPVKTKEVYRDKQKAISVSTLNMKDIESLKDLYHLKYISPFQSSSGTVKFEGTTIKSLIQGVSEDYVRMRDYQFESGSMFTAEDNFSMSRLAVLGATSAQELFKNEDPIDKKIFINNIQFQVIGVLKSKGLESELGNIDNVAIIPSKTFLRRVSNLDYLGQIYISVDKEENCNDMEQEVRSILRENHKLNQQSKEDDFIITNQLSSIKAAEDTSKGFNILIIGVAVLSLIIGGTGILALMIMAVKERVTEIGLRISIGAKKTDILFQFLSESMLIGIIGGLVGVIMGLLFSILTNSISSWQTQLSWQGIIIPFTYSLLTGIIFGAFPAYRAANMDPVDALRSE